MLFRDVHRQLTCYRHIFFATLRFQIDARILFGTTLKKCNNGLQQRFSAIRVLWPKVRRERRTWPLFELSTRSAFIEPTKTERR
jgi:hypothetical protein